MNQNCKKYNDNMIGDCGVCKHNKNEFCHRDKNAKHIVLHPRKLKFLDIIFGTPYTFEKGSKLPDCRKCMYFTPSINKWIIAPLVKEDNKIIIPIFYNIL